MSSSPGDKHVINTVIPVGGRTSNVLCCVRSSSTAVTDLGVGSLLFSEAGDLQPCHSTLRLVKLRGTRVRAQGLRLLLRDEDFQNIFHYKDIFNFLIKTIRRALNVCMKFSLRCCLSLEGVRCNVMDVLQAMSSYLKVNYKARNSFHNLLRRMARGVMVPL